MEDEDEKGRLDEKKSQLDVLDNEHKKRYMDEIIHLEEVKNANIENQFSTCFGTTTDKRVLEFFTKNVIIYSVLFFSMLQVYRSTGSDERSIWVNIITMILGTFLPSPSLNRKK